MGKRKSTVLMVLLTIVIVALCALTIFPSFAIPGTVKIWNPAVMQYDTGADLGGGYYAYYYPVGVISETEYKELSEEDQATYVQYLDKGVYLKDDVDYGVIAGLEIDENENGVSDEFEAEFQKAVDEISARYAKKGYSDYRVSVVDDLVVRVQVPASGATEEKTAFENACATFGLFAETGAMTITLSDSEVSQLDDVDGDLTKIVKEFSVDEQNKVAFIKATFTDLGKKMLDEFSYEVKTAENTSSSSSSSSSAEEVTLKFMIGDEAVITLNGDSLDQGVITTKYEMKYPVANASEKDYVETLVILLNSALHNADGFEVEFETIPTSQVRTYGSVFGENTQLLLYIAMFVVIVALIAYAVVTMGRFGIVGGYATVSYLIITGLCFAFIATGAYEITLGTALVFLVGLVLMNVVHAYTYKAIKTEAGLGKTIDSSVKSGYNKTLWPTVDVYAVLLLGAVALLIGAAGLQTLATQAIICIVTAAFCNLLWTRVINYLFLGASKNKYTYFRVVREDNDDE